MSAGAEVDGVSVEADQLGEAQARLGRDQQQGVIAVGEPRRPIGRGENRLDLGSSQEVHLSLVVALARYGEYALDQRAVCGLLERHNPEEGADGGQAQVPCLGAGTALCLEIGQKRAYEKLEALAAMTPPSLKPGRFRAPDKLMAMLSTAGRKPKYAE
jgi:hypothetical protein